MLECIIHNSSKRQHEWCFPKTNKFVTWLKEVFDIWHSFQQIAIKISWYFRILFYVVDLCIFLALILHQMVYYIILYPWPSL